MGFRAETYAAKPILKNESHRFLSMLGKLLRVNDRKR